MDQGQVDQLCGSGDSVKVERGGEDGERGERNGAKLRHLRSISVAGSWPRGQMGSLQPLAWLLCREQIEWKKLWSGRQPGGCSSHTGK